MDSWINFKQLRQHLDFGAVLQHYGVTVKVRGNGKQHHGFCPLPTHQGKRRSPSFSAHLGKGIWHCFGCGAKGTVLDFAAHMEGLDPAKAQDLRQIALQLQRQLAPSKTQSLSAYHNTRRNTYPAHEADTTKAVINAPLAFVLRGIDYNHRYLLQRGFRADTMSHFGVGYCSSGWLEGRIAIPLHTMDGTLVGYAGRLVSDAEIGEDQPKYKFPGSRDVKSVSYVFRKSLLLYNGHRVLRPVKELIVVEGFTAVWWLWQAGYRNVVAVMGASCSEDQARLILALVHPDGRVLIMPDGDAAGSRCSESLHNRLVCHCATTWVKPDCGKQPTDYAPAELAHLLGHPTPELSAT